MRRKLKDLQSYAALALLPLALAGCVSFGPKPPKNLLALTPPNAPATSPARTTDDAHAVAVATPNALQALATQRVMVRTGPNSIAYLADASWVAAPAALFRDLLAETITARTGHFVPGARQVQIQPDTRLSGQLLDFGLDTASGAVVVTFDAVLQHNGKAQIQARRFTARIPVASEQPTAVAAGLSQAAAQVAGDVADWIGPA